MGLMERTLVGVRAMLEGEDEPWVELAATAGAEGVLGYTWRHRYIQVKFMSPSDPAPELALLPHPPGDAEAELLVKLLNRDGTDVDGWLLAGGWTWDQAQDVLRCLLAVARFAEPFHDLRVVTLREAWGAVGYD
jgi:hypothetical protein